MFRGRAILAVLLAVAFVTGCASGSMPAGIQPDPGERSVPTISRTLKIVARGEPASLGSRPLQSASGVSAVSELFNADLGFVDGQGIKRAHVAESLPELNSDTWQLLPDGRMRTVYRLKPSLTWHDGTPLTAGDFVFGWRVYATPEFGAAGSPPISLMETVSAVDARTLAIEWTRSYPDAGSLRSMLPALPRHVLEETFGRGDREAFVNHPYWTSQYVGLGPYRLERWEPGALMEALAFPGYALGMPKISRVHAVFSNNANAVVASLLTDDVHVVVDYVFMFEHAKSLEKEWAARGLAGTVLYAPTLYRATKIQLRPQFGLKPLQDLRVRRAIAHAWDKHGVNEALIGGTALVTDSITSPRAPYAALVDQALTKYPFDLRRTQQLLEQAGLPRGGDGFFTGPDGEPFRPDLWYIENPTQEGENAIIVNSLRQAGIDAHSAVVPIARTADGELRSTVNAFYTTGGGGFEGGFSALASASIPSPQTRWQGGNHGGWSNGEYDRLWDALNSTLNVTERIQQMVEMERIQSAEVAHIPHYFTPAVTAHVGALRGPVLRTDSGGGWLLEIHNWEWVS